MTISEVYNEDNLIGMARYPDKYFDLAVVDPPYGINRSKNFGMVKFGWVQHKRSEWDNCIPDKIYFKELFRISKNQIIWGGNYFVKYLPPSMGWIVWDKLQTDFSTSDCELAFSSFQIKLRRYKMGRNVLAVEGSIHPTQKPVQLYKWLLKNYAKAGDKILDTHLGSGSSRIACYDGGFDFVAFELDKEYFEAQEKRFKIHCMQQKLF